VPDPYSALGAAVQERADADTFSGVVLLRRGSRVLFGGAYGWASRRWRVPITPEMRFDVASVTKLFTAVAVLRLVDAGRLGIDTPITKVVDLAGTAIAPEVTVRQLLTHTSGIADDADEEDGEDYSDLFTAVPCYGVMEIRDTLQFFVHKPARFPPGRGCRYCNAGYQLLGAAIEAVTGSRYRDHVVADVFRPAGMSASGFFWRQDATPNVAEGWDPDGERPDSGGWRQNVYSYPPVGDAAGGAHVTAADLITFIQALRAGRLLSAESTERFLSPQVKWRDRGERQIWFGFGLMFDRDADGAVQSYFKDGINAGSSAIARTYPDIDVDVAVLSNCETGAWPVIDDVHGAIRAAHPEVGESGF
jgi:CubicO group peptidase (beta-lactamase class C family)